MLPRILGIGNFSLITEVASEYLPSFTSLIYLGISVPAGHIFLQGTKDTSLALLRSINSLLSLIAPVGHTSVQAPQNLQSESINNCSFGVPM
ncbi:hypothetical protein D3C73_1417900 [compost metagenome]